MESRHMVPGTSVLLIWFKKGPWLTADIPYFSAYNTHFFCPEIWVEKWVRIMQWNTKLFIFFPNIAVALLARNLMTKATGPQKYEHSSKIKKIVIFGHLAITLAMSSHQQLILDIFK